jgi:hypothetical protein
LFSLLHKIIFLEPEQEENPKTEVRVSAGPAATTLEEQYSVALEKLRELEQKIGKRIR